LNRKAAVRGITEEHSDMASVFDFDTTAVLADVQYAKSAPAIAKMEKGLASKKIAKAHIDKFVAEYKKVGLNSLVIAAHAYISKNMVAKQLAPVTKDPNVLQKALVVALFGPQKKILQASFDLSVHLKGNSLELQHTDCKGSKKTLITVAP
jgi:Trk K+ transport system NAD-binding subunit